MNPDRFRNIIGASLKNRMILLIVVAVAPMLAMVIYLLVSLQSYSSSYDEIITNMTIANDYNLNFKDEIDESVYKLVARGQPFEVSEQEEGMTNPNELIGDLRSTFRTLVSITTDAESRQWLNNLLRNIDTLEDRVEDLRLSLASGGNYNSDIAMLDNNIYILTELIQDDIQYYLYYQTKSIEDIRNNLNQRIVEFVLVFVVILIVIVILVILILIRTLRGITVPLAELSHVTERIAKGNFDARAGIRTRDEIADLAGSVNDMAKNLQIQVRKIKEDERKMRYTELRLLQEQINPHFLYNALDTIIWLIEGQKTDEAVDMVVSLSEFFKLVLSHGKELITIRDEEIHVRSYLKIQQIRYRDILDYDIDIDPSLYPFSILKMTLQPLVENALYHGIKYKRARGHVQISGEMTAAGNILLSVEDDGVGMDPEELEHLRKEICKPSTETQTGYGMANVNERIHMNFGWNYGISIDSEKGKGTRVEILIPAEMQASGKGGVSSGEKMD